jgi:hypothetical protein
VLNRLNCQKTPPQGKCQRDILFRFCEKEVVGGDFSLAKNTTARPFTILQGGDTHSQAVKHKRTART